MIGTTSANAAGETRPERHQPKMLPGMIGVLAALCIVSGVVWWNRPVPESYNPPPVPPKTVAQVEKEIESIQHQKMPESQRQMVLGFLHADLEKAKQHAASEASGKR